VTDHPGNIDNSGAVASGNAHLSINAPGGYAAGRDIIVGPPPRPDHPCPYPGLLPFEETWGDLFHGRTAEVEQVLDLLAHHPFSAVVGASGSGKSSLLAAGVAHALRTGARPGSEGWTVRPVPAKSPLPGTLCDALRAAYEDAGQVLDDRPGPDALRADPALFGRLSARLARLTDRRVVWLLDQFEGFVAPNLPPADVVCAARAVLSVRDVPQDPPVRVVVAVRTDLYHRLEAVPELAAEVSAHQYWLRPLGEAGLREAVLKPARAAGLTVEEQLVGRLLAEAARGPGTLPLIAHVLERIWERDDSAVLTLAAYEAVGGVGAALDSSAEDAWAELGPPLQDTARRVWTRLAYVGRGERPTRQRARVGDLVSERDTEAEVTSAVEAFVQRRLLTVSGERTVEVAHEVLLEKWRRLGDWLAEDPAAKRLRDDIAAGAAQWHERGEDEGFVLSPGQLRLLELLDSRLWPLNERERAYVEASRRVEEQARQVREQARTLRRRWLLTTAGLALASVLVALSVSLALVLRDAEQRTQRDRTAMDALRLSAQARSAAGERRDVAAALAVAAVRLDDVPATRTALMDVLAAPGGQLVVHRPSFGAASPNVLAARPAGDGTLLLGCSDGALRRVDPVTGALRGTLPGRHGDGVSAVALSGGLVVSGDAGGGVLVQPVPGGAPADGSATGDAGTDGAGTGGDATAPVRLRMPGGEPVAAVAVDDRAHVVLAGGTDGTVARWTVRGAALEPLRLPEEVVAIAVHRPGMLAAATTVTNHVLEVPTAGAGPARPIWETTVSAAGGNAVTAVPGAGLTVVDGDRLHLPHGSAPSPHSSAVAAGTGTVYVGDTAGRVRAWSVSGGVPRALGETFTGPPGDAVTGLATDGSVLAALTREGRLVVWDAAGRRSPAAAPRPAAPGRTVTAVAYGPDGTLASGDDRGDVVLSGTGPHAGARLTLPGGEAVAGLAWTGPGTLAVATADGVLHGVDLATRAQRRLTAEPSGFLDVRATLDGTVLAAWDGRVLLRRRSGAAAPLEGFDGRGVRAVALGPHGEVAVSYGPVTEPHVLLWTKDPATTAPRRLATGHRLYVAALAFSPDGRTLAVGSDDRTVSLWDVRTGGRLGASLTGHTDTVRSLAWSRTGLLASGAEDGTVRLWDTHADAPAAGPPLRYTDDRPVTSLSASPDGDEVAAANGGFTILWPFAPPAWTSLACGFTSEVRAGDMAGYAGGARPADGCP